MIWPVLQFALIWSSGFLCALDDGHSVLGPALGIAGIGMTFACLAYLAPDS